jgi:hypothetical protein
MKMLPPSGTSLDQSKPNMDSQISNSNDIHKSTPPPRRPMTSYNIFFLLERERIVSGGGQQQERSCYTAADAQRIVALQKWKDVHCKRKHRKSHGIISFKDLSVVAAASWRKLDTATKKIFNDMAVVEKSNYVKAMQVWRRNEKHQNPNNPSQLASDSETNRNDHQQEAYPLILHHEVAAQKPMMDALDRRKPPPPPPTTTNVPIPYNREGLAHPSLDVHYFNHTAAIEQSDYGQAMQVWRNNEPYRTSNNPSQCTSNNETNRNVQKQEAYQPMLHHEVAVQKPLSDTLEDRTVPPPPTTMTTTTTVPIPYNRGVLAHPSLDVHFHDSAATIEQSVYVKAIQAWRNNEQYRTPNNPSQCTSNSSETNRNDPKQEAYPLMLHHEVAVQKPWTDSLDRVVPPPTTANVPIPYSRGGLAHPPMDVHFHNNTATIEMPLTLTLDRMVPQPPPLTNVSIPDRGLASPSLDVAWALVDMHRRRPLAHGRR